MVTFTVFICKKKKKKMPETIALDKRVVSGKYFCFSTKTWVPIRSITNEYPEHVFMEK